MGQAARGGLSEDERECVLEYIAWLVERLGENLHSLWLFGSAARGDMWPDWMPMHSDIDLLVLTHAALPPESSKELVDATYPLFLKCGRQISPQFRTLAEFHSPPNDRLREFFDRVRKEGHVIFER